MSAESGLEAARVLMVGGQSRNVGKTALVVDLIRAFPEAGWLAMKITQYGHGVCAVAGGECDCAPQDHAEALNEETDAGGRSDTSRFLAAGARRALWLRTKEGRLAEALPLMRRELGPREAGAAANVIVESNSLRGLLEPRLYLVVLDPAVEDFKESARRFLDRADAFVLRRRPRGEWPAVGKQLFERRPVCVQGMGEAAPGELLELVRERFFGCAGMAHGAVRRSVSS
jgi:hypothetical protein